MDDTSLKYFKRRAEEETRKAQNSPSHAVAEAHRQMARGYEAKASGLMSDTLNWVTD